MQVGFEWLQPPALKLPSQYKSFKGAKFTKRYKTSAGDFEVLLIRTHTDLTKLPIAFVLDKPTTLKGIALPHIRNDGYLCFADNDQSEWNPLDGASLAVAIDRSISRTLKVAVEPDDSQEEYRNEFSNYWEGNGAAYCFEELPIQQKSKVLKYSSLLVKTGRESKETVEFIVYREQYELNRWLELRSQLSSLENGTAVFVSVKPNNWAPTSAWPPNNFAEIMDWLAQSDRSARDNLVFQLTKQSMKRVLVVLQVKNEGHLGFNLIFSSQYHELFKSWSSRKKRSIRQMIDLIRSPKAIKRFTRLRVEAVDFNSVFLRNRPKPEIGDIRDLKIALIGCGTIGSYVADYLVKVGAGVGKKGSLTLYDADKLRVGNLSRHRLPASFLGWNKADGLGKLIEDEALHSVSIKVEKRDFEVSPEKLRVFDLVIDATGRVPVSIALASAVRDIPSNRPVIIYGLNYRWGQESITFIDNGKACYGCMDRLTVSTAPKPDYDTSRYSCGSIYTPHDANVSVMTASLVVEAVLSTLEPKQKWTYAKVTSDKRTSQKRLALKPWADCKVCGR
nr:E2/UBC family protein [Vibrio brasiliensis]